MHSQHSSNLKCFVRHAVVCAAMTGFFWPIAADRAGGQTPPLAVVEGETTAPAAPPESGSAEVAATEAKSAEAKADALDSDAGELETEAAPAATARLRIVATRPEMTAEQRKEWAGRLRQIYAQKSTLWPTPQVDRSVQWTELGHLPKPIEPENNVSTAEKIELGKLLFFDPRLSGSGQMACVSCHDPQFGWADGRVVAVGNHRKSLRRHSPSILNAAYRSNFFWDGRAASLEDQARAVLLNSDEMDTSEAAVVERLAAIDAYRERFAQAFGDGAVTLQHVVEAIACFERTLVGGRSRFDIFLRGNTQALTDEAVIGLHLFRTDAHCMNCHHGPTLSDDQFHDVGLSYYGRLYEDLGRYGVTKKPEDVGRFKTPSLRNVTATRPYMHNGLFQLTGVLNMYNAGMPTLRRKPGQTDDPLFPTKSPLLKPLLFNKQDLQSLAAFLESLEEHPYRMRPPQLPGAAAVPAVAQSAASETPAPVASGPPDKTAPTEGK